MKINILNTSIFVICLSASSITVAQVDSTLTTESEQQEVQTKLKNDELEVIKDFKAKLANAAIINLSPTIKSPPPTDRSYEYDISIVEYQIDYADPVIKPFAMKADEPSDVYYGYAKLGYGNYKSPIADVSYHGQTESASYGALIRYLSLDNSEENVHQKMADLDVMVDADLKINDKHTLRTAVSTRLAQRYLYHIPANEAIEYSLEAAERDLTRIRAMIGIENSSDFALQYGAEIAANTIKITNDDLDELNIDANGFFSYNGESVGIRLDVDAHRSSVNTVDTAMTTISASPGMYWSNDHFSIRLGANAISANDSTYFFPKVELVADVYHDKLQLVLGVDQDYVHNSIHQVTNYNPYYQYTATDYGTTIRRSYYGGLQGAWSRLQYRARMGYRQIDAQATLINGFSDIRKFQMVYQDLDLIYLETTASYELNDIVNIGASFEQNLFDLENDTKAYHLPSMRYHLYSEISLVDGRLRMVPSLAFTDRVDYIDESGNDAQLDAMLALNLQTQYRLSDHIKLFVDGKNLLSNNYAEYYGYDDVGLHVHGGIIVKF